MAAYGIRSTTVLPFTGPLLGILAPKQDNAPGSTASPLVVYAVQQDLICVLRDGQIEAQLAVNSHPPMCLIGSTHLIVCADDRTLLRVEYQNRSLRHFATTSFRNAVDCLCEGGSGEMLFFTSCGSDVHRHDASVDEQNRYSTQLVKTFASPVRALSFADSRLLVLLSSTLHLLNPVTKQDIIEVPCDVPNPVDIFWSVSLQHKFWFAAVVRPEPMSTNRTYKLIMTELGEDVVTSKDVTLDEKIDHSRLLRCKMRGNKLVTIGNNGNTLLIHSVEDFGRVSLLYHAEVCDVPFTAVEIVSAQMRGRTAPLLAVGTSNGAVVWFAPLESKSAELLANSDRTK